MLDPEDRLLLIQSDNPDHGGLFWLTPGGGLEPDEPPWDCLRRELHEETGLLHFDAGPLVWTRRHTFTWKGDSITQHESFYVVRAEPFTPTMDHNPAAVEFDALRGFRWWTPTDLLQSPDRFAPRRLGHFLDQLLRDGPPPRPIDVGL